MSKFLNILKKYRYTFLILIILFIFLSSLLATYAHYESKVSKDVTASVASLICEIDSKELNTNLARGTKLVHYFNVNNYNDLKTTEVAYDYYIYILDEYEEVISDAKLYKYEQVESDNLITKENPNTYKKLSMEEVGYLNSFYGGEFFLDKGTQKFKLEIDKVNTNNIKIKVIGVQKNLS